MGKLECTYDYLKPDTSPTAYVCTRDSGLDIAVVRTDGRRYRYRIGFPDSSGNDRISK